MQVLSAWLWDLLVNKVLVVLAFAYPIAAGLFFYRLRLESDREIEERRKTVLATEIETAVADLRRR